MPRRTKPMLVAPIIPVMGFLGILGIDEFHGSRWIAPVVILWCAGMAALTVFVLRQALAARRRSR